MISYELAKSLKDAGFPQTYSYFSFYYPIGRDNGRAIFITGPLDFDDTMYLRRPSLTELIEWCGEYFRMLVAHDPIAHQVGHWQAIGHDQDRWAKTPEEAVARLGIAIHEQDSSTTKTSRE